MTDVIDSLKRLERAGSEHSKTTEKLLDATRQLSEKIVSQFASDRGENVPVFDVNEVQPEFRYYVQNGWLCNTYGQYVAANRDSALAFSKDVANGLLDYIERVLMQRKAENEETLIRALEKVSKRA